MPVEACRSCLQETVVCLQETVACLQETVVVSCRFVLRRCYAAAQRLVVARDTTRQTLGDIFHNILLAVVERENEGDVELEQQ